MDNTLPTPRMKTARLELRNRYYAVPHHSGTGFAYFPIVVDEDIGKPFLRMSKPPPVLLEGYAIVNKQLYRLTAEDILRRVVRKSNLVTLESINGFSSTPEPEYPDTDTDRDYIEYTGEGSTIDPKSFESLRAAIHSINQLGTGTATPVEVSSAVDAAWNEQIGALLNNQTEEEGNFFEAWEIENPA